MTSVKKVLLKRVSNLTFFLSFILNFFIFGQNFLISFFLLFLCNVRRLVDLYYSASASLLGTFKFLCKHDILDYFTAIYVHEGFHILLLSTYHILYRIESVKNQILAGLLFKL